MQSNNQRKTLVIFAILFFLFFTPMALAWIFYTHQQWLPKHKTNYGQLLSPPLTLSQLGLDTGIHGKWQLFLIQNGPCNSTCQQNVLMQRQIQRALGKDMNRMQRVVVTFAEEDKKIPVETWQDAKPISADLQSFEKMKIQSVVWLIADPLGNIILSYSASISPDDILKDLQHLLEVSKIG